MYASTFSSPEANEGQNLSGSRVVWPGYRRLYTRLSPRNFSPPLLHQLRRSLKDFFHFIFYLFVQGAPDNKYAAAGAAM